MVQGRDVLTKQLQVRLQLCTWIPCTYIHTLVLLLWACNPLQRVCILVKYGVMY
jgi:hypothetical protein